MMKLKNFCIRFSMLFLAALFSCETDGPDDYKNYFIKYYGGDGDQEAKDFVVNNDGTIVMLGTFYETNGENTRLYVVKTDARGNQLWAKKIGTAKESAQDIELITQGTDAGNIILLSNVKKNDVDSTAIRLTIINQEGDSLKSNLFNKLESQRAKSLTTLSDGGYYVVGNTTDTDAGINTDIDPDFEDELLVRFENNWVNSTYEQIGKSSLASGIKLFQVGAEFYYAGHWNAIEQPGGTMESNFFFRKFTNNPTSVATLYVGQKDRNEYLSSIVKGMSGNYLAIGTEITTSTSVVVARVNSNFQTAGPIQSILNSAEGVSVAATGSGDFLVLANKIGTGNVRDIYLMKIDGDGNEIFKTQFGGPNNDDTGSAVLELPNQDILILGTMQLVNQKKMALIKIKPNSGF